MGVEGHEHAPHGRHPELDDGPFQPVLGEQRHVIARREAAIEERARQRHRSVVPLGKGKPAAGEGEEQRFALAFPARPILERGERRGVGRHRHGPAPSISARHRPDNNMALVEPSGMAKPAHLP